MALAPGTQIGKYSLRRKLGAGGYALVFAAHDPSLDREVALKVLKPEHASSDVVVRRFLQEARAAARIIHPGIVTVFECGEISSPDRNEDLTAYIAMELLEGETFADRIERGGRLAPAVVIEIGRQIAAALAAAHRAGIIHRDLKPSNVFLIEDSLVAGGERAKVLDFGIAKLGRTVATPGMQTGSLTVLGTWRYMSPEQCRSAGNIDPRTDVYALGVMLFEALAGQPPFDGHAVELIAQHLMLPPPPLLELAPATPPELAALIHRLLAKEPDARPASMEAVECELEVIANAEGLAPVRPSLLLGVQPRLRTGTARPVTARPVIDQGTTHPATDEGATSPVTDEGTTSPAPPRARRGARGRLYAAGSLLVIASSLGAYLGLRGAGIPPVPDVVAQGEGIPRPPVQLSEPAPDPAATAPDPQAPAPEPTPTATAPESERAGLPAAPVAETAPRVEARGKPAASLARPAANPARPAAASFGFLALAAQPACEIHVDGRAIGARTPLRELRLPAGRHRITLVNGEHAIRDTFSVVIGAGLTERVTKNYAGQAPRNARDATINPFSDGDR